MSIYYVRTDGNNGNTGLVNSAASPNGAFRSVQKGIDVMVAGDTCNVVSGTYLASDVSGGTQLTNVVGNVSSAKASGTALAPITLKSLVTGAVRLTVPSIAGVQNSGIVISRPYWIIDGFEISGGASTDIGAAHHGVDVTTGSDNSIIRHNLLHHIGNVCTDTIFGEEGIYANGGSNVTIDGNTFHDIGRNFSHTFDPTSFCNTTVEAATHNHDHGIYTDVSATNVLIINNLFYNTLHGWGVQIKGNSSAKVYNNTFYGANPNNTYPGQLVFDNGTHSNTDIANNIAYQPGGYTPGFIFYFDTAGPYSNVTVRNNLVYQGVLTALNLTGNAQPAGVTASGNIVNATNPNLVDPVNHDFRLQASSASALNAGLTLVQVTADFLGVARPQGAGYDIGAYEFSSTDTTPPAAPINLRIV
jgi:hypothetical protein